MTVLHNKNHPLAFLNVTICDASPIRSYSKTNSNTILISQTFRRKDQFTVVYFRKGRVGLKKVSYKLESGALTVAGQFASTRKVNVV